MKGGRLRGERPLQASAERSSLHAAPPRSAHSPAADPFRRTSRPAVPAVKPADANGVDGRSVHGPRVAAHMAAHSDGRSVEGGTGRFASPGVTTPPGRRPATPSIGAHAWPSSLARPPRGDPWRSDGISSPSSVDATASPTWHSLMLVCWETATSPCFVCSADEAGRQDTSCHLDHGTICYRMPELLAFLAVDCCLFDVCRVD